MKRIYLDYAASTPVDPRVLKTMEPYFGAAAKKFGNPGSLHSFGQAAIAALDHARETVAAATGAEFREVIFTSSATEANNLALRGAAQKAKALINNPRIIISSVEHESIIETARDLMQWGIDVVFVPADRDGVVDVKKIKASLDECAVLVSVMHANNEVGTIQPIAEIGKVIADFKKEKPKGKNNYPLFHTDAAQSFQFLDCDVRELGVDLMTLSSHKIYGPKGAAALYVKHNGNNGNGSKFLASGVFGGGQEYGLRSGTENVPAILGFAKAIELAGAVREKESKRIASLKNEFWRGIKKIYPKAALNGAADDKTAAQQNLPNLINIYFPGHAAQDLLTKFDLAGLAASLGSACRSRAAESSYVIEALGYSKERARSSIRFSLGRPTTKAEIAAALRIIKMAVGSA